MVGVFAPWKLANAAGQGSFSFQGAITTLTIPTPLYLVSHTSQLSSWQLNYELVSELYWWDEGGAVRRSDALGLLHSHIPSA